MNVTGINTSRPKSVAVIGAGPSGLCTIKELRQEGHETICFERESDLGGVFRFSPDPSGVGVWRSCRLTSSALVTTFSDFPAWRESEAPQHRHWTHHEYVDYLKDYADAFSLLQHVRFGSEVRSVEPDDEGRWRLHIGEVGETDTQVQTFDAVAICSGLHREPAYPDLPGLSRFKGSIVHSAHYKDPSDLDASSVVFVGAGESGGEIIDELSHHLENAYVSLRRGVFVIPRLLNGLPNDYTGTRLLYSLPEFAYRRSDRCAESHIKFLTSVLFPLALLRRAILRIHRTINQRFREATLADQAENKLMAHVGASARLARRKALDGRAACQESIIEALRAKSGGNQFEHFATKTEAFVNAIADGRAELRPFIREVLPDGVVFEDGQRVRADTLFFCTGFRPASAPFLVPKVDLARLYLNFVAPGFGGSLSFIGFLRPPLGAIPPMAEMQARLFAQIVSGHVHLPPEEAMEVDTTHRLAKRRAYFSAVFDRLPQLVDYSTYMDEMAERIGCKPRAVDYLLQPRLLFKLYTAPFSSAQYRLRGPHAKPGAARNVLLSAPSHFMLVRFADLALARLASLAGLEIYRPRLTLFGHRRPSRADRIE